MKPRTRSRNPAAIGSNQSPKKIGGSSSPTMIGFGILGNHGHDVVSLSVVPAPDDSRLITLKTTPTPNSNHSRDGTQRRIPIRQIRQARLTHHLQPRAHCKSE
jgi:hypothetical protein